MSNSAGNGAANPAAAEAFDRLAREATIRTTGLAFDKVLGYAFFLLVTKTFGPDDFSVYLAGVAAVEITLALAELGLERSAIRAVAQNCALGRPGEVRRIVHSALALVVPTGVLAALGAIVFAESLAGALGRPEAAPFLRAVAPAIPLSLVADALLWSAEGLGMQRYLTVIRMAIEPIVKIALTVGVFFAFRDEAGPRELGLAYSASTAVSAVLAFVVYRRVVLRRAHGAAHESHTAALLRDGLPLWGNALLGRLFAKADVILLYAFASAPSAALYAMAFNTALLTTMIATAFEAAFRPAVARAVALGERAELANQFVRVSRIVFTICLPASLMLLFFPAQVMAVVGDQFVPISNVVPFLAVGTLSGFVVGPAASVLIMAGRPRIPLTIGLVSGFVTLAIEFALIPTLGALGAAMAQCVGLIVASSLNGIAAWRELGVSSLSRLHLSPVVAAVAASGIAFVVSRAAPENKYSAFVLIGGGLAVSYFTLLFVLGVSADDKRTIAGLFSQVRAYMVRSSRANAHFPSDRESPG
jgi:O-antigen/teichoic acid export membrane protein